jgi:hypothetical protein
MAAMDFDGAIQAHAAWKLKLGSYLRRPDRSIDHNVFATASKAVVVAIVRMRTKTA